jgi:hypothetical protein
MVAIKNLISPMDLSKIYWIQGNVIWETQVRM